MNVLKRQPDDFLENWNVRRPRFISFIDDFAPDHAMFTRVKIPTKERHAVQPRDEGRIIKLAFSDIFDSYCRVICCRIVSVDTPQHLELEVIADSEHYFNKWGDVAESIEWVGERPVGITLDSGLIFRGALYEDEARNLRSRYGPNADEKMPLLQQALYWFYRDESEV